MISSNNAAGKTTTAHQPIGALMNCFITTLAKKEWGILGRMIALKNNDPDTDSFIVTDVTLFRLLLYRKYKKNIYEIIPAVLISCRMFQCVNL